MRGEKMTISRNLFSALVNKKVEIHTKPIGTTMQEKYVGKVVGGYTTTESFIVLDTNELINIKYIAMIKIID